MFHYVESPVFHSDRGTPYLKSAGAHLISRPEVELGSLESFFLGFSEDLKFNDYLDDTGIDDGAQLVKFAGQACYASFGPKRTKNTEAQKYLTHIKESGHGSTFEHANYSFFFYGVSRSLTHELVRHRAGFGFSQLSQRYVSGSVLRFVERPEYQKDSLLHAKFLERIDRAKREYEDIASLLFEKQVSGDQTLSADRKTDLRKKVQQTARSVLPNETETFLVVTANARAWRHFCEMRGEAFAETEIRGLALSVYKCLNEESPLLFGDYEVKEEVDGIQGLKTAYRKI